MKIYYNIFWYYLIIGCIKKNSSKVNGNKRENSKENEATPTTWSHQQSTNWQPHPAGYATRTLPRPFWCQVSQEHTLLIQQQF